MKKLYLMVCMLGVVFASCNLATASIPVLWQADVNHPSQAAISRIKLTPDNGNLMVFGHSPSHGSPIIVDKFNASNGSSIWSKPLSKSGKRLAYGWVDSADNLYVLSVWSGYTLWKYDSELVTELWPYTNPISSFEYVMNIITDELNNVYATGSFGSGSGAGSTLVKLDPNGILAWPQPSTYTATSGKDNYSGGIALDSNKNVFRGGTDDEVYDSQRGRLLGHDANDGTVFLDVSVDETNSEVYGVIVDKNDNIIIGYTYNLLNPDRTPTNLERTVVQRFNQSGVSLWKYTFPDIGMFMCNRNCVVKRNDNSFYVAYNLRKDGTVYPGVAEFDIDGNLIWRDTLNEPGWTIPCIDAPANKDLIYVGLTNVDDGSQTQVLCLTAEPIVLTPNGGENLVAGSSYPITWETGPVVYFNDFEDANGSMTEWSTDTNDTTPGTPNHPPDRFLGQFYNDTVTLTLNNLPPHTEVSVSFDLYIIRTWDGLDNEPDFWGVGVESGPTLLNTTFCNVDWGPNPQSYPAQYPDANHPPFTGASEIRTLGYAYDTYGVIDSVYRFPNTYYDFTFAHSEPNLILHFSAWELEFSPSDESWGLDNVKVSVTNTDFVLIEYSTNNGQDWNDVDIWWNTGSYDWDPVPGVDSNQCLVRISDLFDPDVSDTSDDVFTIFQCLEPIPGDLNDDCYVDFRDFAVFAGHWLECGNPFDENCGLE